jgi:hypothetical protein
MFNKLSNGFNCFPITHLSISYQRLPGNILAPIKVQIECWDSYPSGFSGSTGLFLVFRIESNCSQDFFDTGIDIRKRLKLLGLF